MITSLSPRPPPHDSPLWVEKVLPEPSPCWREQCLREALPSWAGPVFSDMQSKGLTCLPQQVTITRPINPHIPILFHQPRPPSPRC